MNLKAASLFIFALFLNLNVFAVDYFWIGGSGNWSDISHWATSSGGTGTHLVVPSINDDVYFDANSFTGPGQTITINSLNAVCKNLDFSGVSFSPTLSGNSLRISGSATLASAMQISLSGDFRFVSTNDGNTLDLAGQTWPTNLRFEGVGGGWTPSGNLDLPNGTLFLSSGDLDLSGLTVNALSIQSSSPQVGSLNISNATLNLGGSGTSWVFNGVNASLISTGSTINLNATGPGFTSSNFTYNQVVAQEPTGTASFSLGQTVFNGLELKGNANFLGSWEVDALQFAPGKTYSLEAGETMEVKQSWTGSGNCQAYTEITGQGGLAQIQLLVPISMNYMRVGDLENLGPSAYTLNHSLDLGGNVNLSIVSALARNLYWVGGDGLWSDTLNWSLSSGGPGGECLPLPVDDVFFDGNSFTAAGEKVTISGTEHAYCHSMDWSGANFAPELEMNNGRNLYVHGNLTVNANMTFGGNYVVFKATDLGNTITTNGTQIQSNISFDGAGGEWLLQDDLNMAGQIIGHANGRLVTNSNNVFAAVYSSTPTNPRELVLGSSTITLDVGFNSNAPATAWDLESNGMTLNAGTSLIKLITPNSRFRTRGPGNPTYYNVDFDFKFLAGEMTGTATFNQVRFGAHGNLTDPFTVGTLIFSSGYQYFMEPGITVSLTQNLDALGTCTEQITIFTLPTGTAGFQKSGSNINVTYCTLENITATGTANFTASSSVNLGGNAGWTFIPRSSLDFYWIGGDGRWEDGSQWSYSSGGPPANCIPSPVDDVFFDGNSFTGVNQTVKVDTNKAYCRNMDWTGSSGNPIFDADESVYIYGSLKLISNLNWQPKDITYFVGQGPGHTIEMAGNPFPKGVWFERIGGGWTLMDDFVVQAPIQFITGAWNTQGNYVEAQLFSSTDALARDWVFGSSEFLITGGGTPWQVNRSGLTLNSGTSLIRLSAAGANFRTYPAAGNPVVYHNLRFEAATNTSRIREGNQSFTRVDFASNGILIGDNTYDTLAFTSGKAYQLKSQDTQTILDEWIAIGDCINYVEITSTTPGNLATVSSPSGTIALNRVILQDIEATGGATFNATVSIDNGNNPGWNIGGLGGAGLYWIGDAGNWSDPNHWALFSGGPPSGCIPTQYDDVYFDQNSFTQAGQTVSLDIDGECHNMDWTGAGFDPSFFSATKKIDLYGSMTLNEVMQLNLTGPVNFVTDEPAHFIKSYGHVNAFPNSLTLDMGPSGEVTLVDSLSVNGALTHSGGYFAAADEVLSLGSFISGGDPRVMDMQTSEWNIQDQGVAWNVDPSGLTLNKGNSLVHMRGNQAIFQSGGSLDYNNLVFHGLLGFSEIQTDLTDFGYVLFLGDGKMNGSNDFDTLQFNAGYTYLLEEGDTQTVHHEFFARGNNCFPIVIHSQNIPNPAFIFKAGGLVDSDFLELNSVHALGGANFYAGIFSVDAGNNLNWNFSNSGNYEYGLGPDTTVLLCTSLDTFHIVTLNFNGGIAWLWQDGYTGPNYPAFSSGLYSVTVTFANNCQTTDSVFVQVDSFRAEPNLVQTICLGDTAVLTTNDSRGGFDYLWSTGETDSIIRVNPSSDATYWVDVTFGNYTCRDSLFVQVNDPQLSISVINPLCAGDDDGELEANFTGGLGGLTYSWSTGSPAKNITGLSDGWYVVEVTDSLGCTRKDSAQIVSPPPLDVSFTLDTIDCVDSTGSISVLPLGGSPGYTVLFNGISPDAVPPGTHVFQVLDTNGCTLDTVFTMPQPDSILILSTVTETDCPYDASGSIGLSPNGQNQPYTYFWSTGDTSSSIGGIGVGVYQVEVTNSIGCKAYFSFTVESSSDILADGFVGPQLGIRPLEVDFENYSIDSDSVKWVIQGASGPVYQNDFDYTFDQVGDYEIMLVAYDSINGCTDTVYFSVTVESNPDVSDPDVFSPNGDGVNDVFYFDVEDIGTFHAMIYNRWGQLVYEWYDPQEGWNGLNMNGEEVSAGTYFYILNMADLNNRPVQQSGFLSVFR